MLAGQETGIVRRKYRDVFGAELSPCFNSFLNNSGNSGRGAVLGYRRAGIDPLFCEQYIDGTMEAVVSAALGRAVARHDIVELGNFASDNAIAMVELWGDAANDLGGASEIAVATLTAPLRHMFARIGVPVVPLAPARPECLDGDAAIWGSYYRQDPWVCAGVIAQGQAAIAAFLARRRRARPQGVAA